MRKKLLMTRDIPLSVLAGHAVYKYSGWTSTSSAVYCGIVVAALCGCALISLNESARQRKMRRRDGSPRSANKKIYYTSIIGN